jgi:hypothetical protein
MPPQYRGIQGTWTKCLFNTKGPLYHTGALRKYGHDASSIQRDQGHLDRMPLHYRGTQGIWANACSIQGDPGYTERLYGEGCSSTIQVHPVHIEGQPLRYTGVPRIYTVDRKPLHHTRAPQAIWRSCRKMLLPRRYTGCERY